jgi:hypothetical protein
MDGPATAMTSIAGTRVPIGERVAVFDSSYPVVSGPPPVDSALGVITALARRLTKAHTEAWTGVKHVQPRPKLDRASFRSRQKIPYSHTYSPRFVGTAVRWSFIWPAALYDIVSRQYPELLEEDHITLVRKSRPYHPFLSLQHSYRIVRRPLLFLPPSGASLFTGGVTL